MNRTFFAKYLKSDSDVKKSPYVEYKGEFYRSIPTLCSKDPKIYNFIQKDDERTGYHEKWEDLNPVDLLLCTSDLKIGDTDYDTGKIIENIKLWDYKFEDETSRPRSLCFKTLAHILTAGIKDKQYFTSQEVTNLTLKSDL